MTISQTKRADRWPQAVAFGLVSLSAWAVWASGPLASSRSSQPTPAVPAKIGAWVGRPVTVDRRTVEILETDEVAVMEYEAPGEPSVALAQVAGFGNRAAFHPPELCFVGSHFEVLERQPLGLTINDRTHQVMRLVVSQGNDRFEAWYWFTVNGRVTHNYYQQQLWLVWEALRGRSAGGTLVRISTSDADGRAEGRLRAFFGALQTASTT